uniref:Uncharacterized protein n=1 Tax=Chromera velia CCMP2878 TaxID=1169474 RepID=A0A0G4HZL5_9ALVE|eukprot:Cvel_9757.t1-p1 / transcript=Cvel_9757.t1 / gene=Cvel_9757 / organism=Chromera_velia_CCMP2878 / gene_product=Myosin-11, putative / transcript_product=Myosin-11, putative / location=Cvel_scaffold571:32007-38462(+) / protein_length=1427 / sequence_SO=supercontig / SO=protein_coding / is_pseudo=false
MVALFLSGEWMQRDMIERKIAAEKRAATSTGFLSMKEKSTTALTDPIPLDSDMSPQVLQKLHALDRELRLVKQLMKKKTVDQEGHQMAMAQMKMKVEEMKLFKAGILHRKQALKKLIDRTSDDIIDLQQEKKDTPADLQKHIDAKIAQKDLRLTALRQKYNDASSKEAAWKTAKEDQAAMARELDEAAKTRAASGEDDITEEELNDPMLSWALEKEQTAKDLTVAMLALNDDFEIASMEWVRARRRLNQVREKLRAEQKKDIVGLDLHHDEKWRTLREEIERLRMKLREKTLKIQLVDQQQSDELDKVVRLQSQLELLNAEQSAIEARDDIARTQRDLQKESVKSDSPPGAINALEIQLANDITQASRAEAEAVGKMTAELSELVEDVQREKASPAFLLMTPTQQQSVEMDHENEILFQQKILQDFLKAKNPRMERMVINRILELVQKSGLSDFTRDTAQRQMEETIKNSLRQQMIAKLRQETTKDQVELLNRQYQDARDAARYEIEKIARREVQILDARDSSEGDETTTARMIRHGPLVAQKMAQIDRIYDNYLAGKRQEYERDFIVKPFNDVITTKMHLCEKDSSSPDPLAVTPIKTNPVYNRIIEKTITGYNLREEEFDKEVRVAKFYMSAYPRSIARFAPAALDVVAAPGKPEEGADFKGYIDQDFTKWVSTAIHTALLSETGDITSFLELGAATHSFPDPSGPPASFLELSQGSRIEKTVLPKYHLEHAAEREVLHSAIVQLSDEIQGLTEELAKITQQLEAYKTRAPQNEFEARTLKREVDALEQEHNSLQSQLAIRSDKKSALEKKFAGLATRDNSVQSEMRTLKTKLEDWQDGIEKEEAAAVQIDILKLRLVLSRKKASMASAQTIIELEAQKRNLNDLLQQHRTEQTAMKGLLKRYRAFPFLELMARQLTRHMEQDFYEQTNRCKPESIKEVLDQYVSAVKAAQTAELTAAPPPPGGLPPRDAEKSLMLALKWDRMKEAEELTLEDTRQYMELRSKLTDDVIDLFANVALDAMPDSRKIDVLDEARTFTTDEIASARLEAGQNRIRRKEALRDPSQVTLLFEKSQTHQKALKDLEKRADANQRAFLSLRDALLDAVLERVDPDMKAELEALARRNVDFQLELIKEAIFGRRASDDAASIVSLQVGRSALCEESLHSSLKRQNAQLVYALEREAVDKERDTVTLAKVFSPSTTIQELKADNLRMRDHLIKHMLYQLASGESATSSAYLVEVEQVNKKLQKLKLYFGQKGPDELIYDLQSETQLPSGSGEFNMFSQVQSAIDMVHGEMQIPNMERLESKCILKPLLEELYDCDINNPISCDKAYNAYYQARDLAVPTTGSGPTLTPGCHYSQLSDDEKDKNEDGSAISSRYGGFLEISEQVIQPAQQQQQALVQSSSNALVRAHYGRGNMRGFAGRWASK